MKGREKELEFFLAGSLEKVFPDQRPEEWKEGERLCILKGETPAIQLVYFRRSGGGYPTVPRFACRVSGFPAQARLREVELVPSAFPCFEQVDDNYLRTEPGMFPDLLKPCPDGWITPRAGQYRALWIDFPDTSGVPAGEYRVEITLMPETEGVLGNGQSWRWDEERKQRVFSLTPMEEGETKPLCLTLEVSEETLPKQSLIHTEWFHSDCVADYYQTEVFGEAHWKALESQIAMAAEIGINTLLTPVFTPPLDTAVGGERTTVQLVGITQDQGGYHFDFSLLERWCGLCRKYGIEYLEMPHLFTQWGAEATPKILVSVDGKTEKRFGWHVPADSPAYREFLQEFLPMLQEKLQELGFDKEHVFFHISDEPSQEQLDSYERAKKVTEDLLEGWRVIDALSDYAFYESGAVKHPVPANNHIQPFADHGVPGLWTYYCCSQGVAVPNRFFAMPSARNRIMGVLMYLYEIQGFLHWGYNFYNSGFSRKHIDPFYDTHADYSFPSGDSFLVYPGPEGETWSSVRAQVQLEGIQDLGALCRLEKMAGRERVLELIYAEEDGPFTFQKYPADAGWLYRLRERIAGELAER
ncbi:MAG TPA: DUF4091 domain-containing protein [Candidatus Eisenbergiella merdavium]|uniref:DUF4091 domain-containing protein n=1 Tax=Candidatus Eisenbergiella merdavium TaxID=2838551 RepID=A0A9D2NE01_9FIRM|nr:DUF4091 domain-containing protein [Candidatus Eisenbergiella merdavium]